MICKIKKSKLLSAILAIAMIVTLMPVTAFAAEPPTLVSAAVTSDGGVGLTFSKEMSAADLANKIKSGFTISGLEETPKTITNVSLHSASGGTNNFVQLYLSPTIKGGEVAGLSYTPGDVQAADGGVLAEIASMDIENNAPHPDLVTTAPPAATVGSAYTHTLTASGGTGPYTFSVDNYNLPSGLTLSSTGVISGTPTVAASFTFYIMVEDANQALDIEGFSITVNAPSANVCAIGSTEYATLDAALAAVPAGGAVTVKLLGNINHNAGVFLEGKKVTFALNGYTLNINNPAEGGFGLAVQQGGAVYLSGSGALNATGETYGVRVSTSVLSTQATVTNATATGPTGEAAYAAGPATLTVLEDATVTGVNAYGAHAISKAMIDIKGNVNASNQGVYASDAIIKVAGNVTAAGLNILNEPVGIGVGVYGGTGAVEIGGNVTANRVGAMVRAGGSITIDGMLTAPAYIQFADDEPTAIEDFITQTTKTGYRTYQHPTAGTVWMLGEMPTTTYALTVTNGTGGGSYAKDAVIAITANTAPSGQGFKEWSITPSATFTDSTNKTSQTAKIIMPAQPVAATAIYEVLPASKYTITVQNDGNGTASANFNSASEGAEITLSATPNNGYRFKEWQVISGGVTIANNKFSMLDSNVTVKAIFEPVPAASYNVAVNGSYVGTSGVGSYTQGATVTIHAGSRSSYSFKGWTSSDGVAFANAGSAITTFIMPSKNVAVTANWSYIGGGSGSDGGSPSGGSSSGSSSAPGHFSIFGIGSKTDVPAFTDIANHWAKEDIEFVTARGLFSGTGNSQFSPNTSMTRGMFVTALGRLAGIDATAYKDNKFIDVPETAYYAPYVVWAVEKGIISGTDVTTFTPDQNISRQEMAVIISNYAKVMGYTVQKNREAVTFSDNSGIASWAQDAVKSMQMAGVLMGNDGNHFDPTASATRAEAAAVLHRYVELVIDKATALKAL